MTAIYIHDGTAIDHIPAADIPLGSVVVLGAIIGVATRAIPAGTLGSLCLEGVFDVPRTVGVATPVGTRLFWDATNQRATVDDAGGTNPALGVAVRAATDTDTTIRVRLDP
jgi:predicted RecA/RadA family phage recombinase